MVKRIGSTAWRVEVSNDGNIFALGVRTELGREYEVLLGTVDSTPLLSDLLNGIARTHKALPPKQFSEGAGPNHFKSVPLTPLETRVEAVDGKPVLALDFGGAVLKVAIDPAELQNALAQWGKTST
ncbi:hypothetical protein [Microvirga flavescens]|uniref:hypothetical protein n=1 Tax=Microvirga flavescens TaxID=2249811 RepID=UPI000DD4F79F|nr:hypothetical protein [Microvirga flavescens]